MFVGILSFLRTFFGFLYSLVLTRRFRQGIYLQFIRTCWINVLINTIKIMLLFINIQEMKKSKTILSVLQKSKSWSYLNPENSTKTVANSRLLSPKISQIRISTCQSDKKLPRIPNTIQLSATIFLQKILKRKIMKVLHKIYRVFKIKCLSLKLISTLSKRYKCIGFYSIKNYWLVTQTVIYGKLADRCIQTRVLLSILKRLITKQKYVAWERIRFTAGKVRKRYILINNLNNSLTRLIKQSIYCQLFNKLKAISLYQMQKTIFLPNILKHTRNYSRFMLKTSFDKLIQYSLFQNLRQKNDELTEKSNLVKQFNKTKRITITSLKQTNRNLCFLIGQENKNKSKILQSLKKKQFDRQTRKIGSLDVKQYEKLKLKQEDQLRIVQQQLTNLEKIMDYRLKLAFKSQNAENKCHQLYALISKSQQQQLKKKEYFLKNQSLEQFIQTQNFLFQQNENLSKLIEYYENINPKTLQPEYYNLQYENNAIKQTISTFMKRSYLDYVIAIKKQ